jgi:hypothetical protein
VFDYKDPDVANKIKEFSRNKIAHAVDTIAEGDTPSLTAASMGSDGGYIALLLPAEVTRADVKAEFSLVYTLLGKARFITAYGDRNLTLRSRLGIRNTVPIRGVP